MASSDLPDILLTGTHASRPAATAVVGGSLYACSDHDLVYQSDGATWSTWATLGSPIADILDLPTAEMDDTLVLAPDGAGGVEFRAEAGGGGGGYDLDTYTIDATYGDDFTGASLNTSLWTRRNFTSGAETYQLGKNATYIRIAATGRISGDGYFQTAPGGDWTFAMACVARYWPNGQLPWGVCVVNSVGTGVGTCFYHSPSAFIVNGITTYSTYSGSFQQVTTFNDGQAAGDYKKTWQYLRKSGTDYYGAFSFDGEIWCPETPVFSSAITVDRVGMLINPLSNGVTAPFADVDWFNKIA